MNPRNTSASRHSMCEALVAAEALLTFDMKPRAGRWADLVMTARRSDRKRPVVFVVPYDGSGYRLERWFSPLNR